MARLPLPLYGEHVASRSYRPGLIQTLREPLRAPPFTLKS
jgi:hypothetical protein